MGIASQYAPGVSQSVIHVRQTRNVSRPLPLQVPSVDGFLAVRDCDRIGEVWHLRPINGKVESFWVIDCAGSRETRDWMDRNGIIGEVDYETAARWNTIGRGIEVERIVIIDRRRGRVQESEVGLHQLPPVVAPPGREVRLWAEEGAGDQSHSVQGER